jgi:hypothetical protein
MKLNTEKNSAWVSKLMRPLKGGQKLQSNFNSTHFILKQAALKMDRENYE